ncbi:uncharacterized protein LOC142351613 [Convolutriloba macropyga]|uniref:uncharacterized protein LOC142351613 n=1 Tax=Convolutriloba macropyga TaxID=536237 RepID=UPI003F528930
MTANGTDKMDVRSPQFLYRDTEPNSGLRNPKIAKLVRLVFLLVVVGVIGMNQFFIFSMWIDNSMDDVKVRLTSQEQTAEYLQVQLSGNVASLKMLITEAETELETLQSLLSSVIQQQDINTAEIGQLAQDMNNNDKDIPALNTLQDKVDILESAILSGYVPDNTGSDSVITINETSEYPGMDDSSGSVGQVTSVQMQLLMAKIDKNSDDISELRQADLDFSDLITEVMNTGGSGGGGGVTMTKLPLVPITSFNGVDISYTTDGIESLSQCYSASAPQQVIYFEVEGRKDVLLHAVKVMSPQTAAIGDVINVYGCLGEYCNLFCDSIVVLTPGGWEQEAICHGPVDFFYLYNESGYLSFCEVEAEGYIL